MDGSVIGYVREIAYGVYDGRLTDGSHVWETAGSGSRMRDVVTALVSNANGTD